MQPFTKITKHLFIILFLLWGGVLSAQNSQLRLDSDVWPPFTNVRPEKAIAMDIVEEALKRMDIEAKFSITDFDQVISGINQGTYDGSAALWKNAKREESLLFSDPYLENQLVLVGRKGASLDLDEAPAERKIRIGVVQNYAYGDSLFKNRNVELVFSENDQENLRKLLSKKIDYMLVDNFLIQHMLKYQVNDVQEYLTIADKPFITKSLHFAINKNLPDAENLISGFNAEIKSMMADGTYNTILGLNWIEVDVNGDGNTEIVFSDTNLGTEPPSQSYPVFYRDQQSYSEKGYVINNEYYRTWYDVPVKFKNKSSVETRKDGNPGLQFKF